MSLQSHRCIVKLLPHPQALIRQVKLDPYYSLIRLVATFSLADAFQLKRVNFSKFLKRGQSNQATAAKKNTRP